MPNEDFNYLDERIRLQVIILKGTLTNYVIAIVQ